MIVPRSTPRGTRVEGYFTTEFWKAYVNAYMLGANEKPLGNIRAIFSEAICSALQARLGSGALETVVFFSENLSNRVLAINIGSRSGEQEIIINARFKVDPEILAHTIVEEFVHAWQRLEDVDFAAQSSQFAYDERPYEIEAKRIATEILGYEPDVYETYIRRDEPDGVLYDRAG